jgi:hypothetical protein
VYHLVFSVHDFSLHDINDDFILEESLSSARIIPYLYSVYCFLSQTIKTDCQLINRPVFPLCFSHGSDLLLPASFLLPRRRFRCSSFIKRIRLPPKRSKGILPLGRMEDRSDRWAIRRETPTQVEEVKSQMIICQCIFFLLHSTEDNNYYRITSVLSRSGHRG